MIVHKMPRKSVKNHNLRFHNNYQIVRCHFKLFEYFYTNRIAKYLNIFPAEILETELSESGFNTAFKRKIREWLLNYFTENFDVNNTCSWVFWCSCSNCRRI